MDIKNIIEGEVFNRKFKIKFKDDLSKIFFKLLNTGVSAELNLSKKQSSDELIGHIRGKYWIQTLKRILVMNQTIL